MRSRTKSLVIGAWLVLGLTTAGRGGSAPTTGAAPSPDAAGPASAAASAAESAAAGAEVSAGDVASGLREIDGIAQQVASSVTDKAKAAELVGRIEPRWRPIEDTVKANSADAYTAFEDAFSVLEDASTSGDTAAAAKGAKDLSDTVASYTSRYPG
jgi:hypothetical protein